MVGINKYDFSYAILRNRTHCVNLCTCALLLSKRLNQVLFIFNRMLTLFNLTGLLPL